MFTSIGLWSISTKTILTNVVYLDGGINGFDPKQWNGVDKVLHGRGGIMIILKINIGVFIVPEMTESEHKDRLGSSLGLGLNDYLGN